MDPESHTETEGETVRDTQNRETYRHTERDKRSDGEREERDTGR